MTESLKMENENITDDCKADDPQQLLAQESSSSLKDSEINELERRIQSACNRLSAETPTEVFATSVYATIVEAGFQEYTITEQDDEYGHSHSKQPKTTQTKDFVFKFTLPECPDLIFTLNSFIIGNDAMLSTFSIPDPLTSFSNCFEIKRYIVDESKLIFDNLKELRFVIRDKLCTPVRSAAISARGIASASLIGLPHELTRRILLFCGPVATCRAAQACRNLRDASIDEVLWHKFYNSYLKGSKLLIHDNTSMSWLTKYRVTLLYNKQKKKFSYYPNDECIPFFEML